jgi:hypothetical protein
LSSGEFTLAPLMRGQIVLAGTVLGHLGRRGHDAPAVTFQVRPAHAKTPVDPRPIIAGWELLGKLTAGRAAVVGLWGGAYGAGDPSLGQLLLGSKAELGQAVLSDPRVTIGRCGRRDILAGTIDRRVLGVIEYLSYSGLAPGVSGFGCGPPTSSGAPLGTRVDISRLDGIPVAGHQQQGGIVDSTIRRLLRLQGALRPSQIVGGRSYPGELNTTAWPDHAARIEIDFSQAGSDAVTPLAGGLDTPEWKQLIGRHAPLSAQPDSTAAVPALPVARP